MYLFAHFCNQDTGFRQFSARMLAQLSAHIVNQSDRTCVAHAEVDGLLRASVCICCKRDACLRQFSVRVLVQHFAYFVDRFA